MEIIKVKTKCKTKTTTIVVNTKVIKVIISLNGSPRTVEVEVFKVILTVKEFLTVKVFILLKPITPSRMKLAFQIINLSVA